MTLLSQEPASFLDWYGQNCMHVELNLYFYVGAIIFKCNIDTKCLGTLSQPTELKICLINEPFLKPLVAFSAVSNGELTPIEGTRVMAYR